MKKYLFVISLLLSGFCAAWAQGDAKLVVEEFSIKAGEAKDISIALENPNDPTLCNFQFDITLPEAITFTKKNASRFNVKVNKDREEDPDFPHSASANLREGNLLRVVVSSTENAPFVGSTGTIVTINIQAADDMPSGQYDCLLSGVKLSYPDADIHPGIVPADVVSHFTVESATGLQRVNGDLFSSDNAYDLNGRRLDTHTDGIRIKEGKAILKK